MHNIPFLRILSYLFKSIVTSKELYLLQNKKKIFAFWEFFETNPTAKS